MVEGAVEGGAQLLVEDLLDLAQAVPPRGVQQHEVAARQVADARQQLLEVEVAVARGPLPVAGLEERALEEDHLGRRGGRAGLEDPRPGVGAVGEEIGLDRLGDRLAGLPPARDLLAGQPGELRPQMVAPPDHERAEGRHPVVGGEEAELHVAAQRQRDPRRDRDHLDRVGLAALEAGVSCEQGLDVGGDLPRRRQLGRAHGLEVALAGPVGDAAEVVGVAVAEADGRHRRQGAVRATGVEGEVQLRQQDQGAFAGA